MKELIIHCNEPYPIYMGKWSQNDCLFQRERMPRQGQVRESLCISTGYEYLVNHCHGRRWAIIHDDNPAVANIARNIQQDMQISGLSMELFSFPSGEIHKTRETKQHLEDQLLSHGYGRDAGLIAVGGGVTSDLVGFIASTYCRGIPCIYVPTTLLAMVDASIGGKTGLNTAHGKNLIGTFQQPQAVFMDINTLKTLPEKEWQNGWVEMIKHALIADAELFELLKDSEDISQRIYRSCVIKKNIVEKDEKEQGLRQLLNFGHTIGHAIEQIEQYEVSHGEAVAIGMLVEAYLSLQCGFLSQGEFHIIETRLRNIQLAFKTKAFADKEVFLEMLTRDKKSKAGDVYFVLLDKIGQAHEVNGKYAFCVDAEILSKTLDWAKNEFTL